MRHQQQQLFTRAELSAMRDRTRARNYSPDRENFRRDHERRRYWGLKRRHAERLRQLREGTVVEKDGSLAHSHHDLPIKQEPDQRHNHQLPPHTPAAAPTPTPALDPTPAPASTAAPMSAPAPTPAHALTPARTPAPVTAPVPSHAPAPIGQACPCRTTAIAVETAHPAAASSPRDRSHAAEEPPHRRLTPGRESPGKRPSHPQGHPCESRPAETLATAGPPPRENRTAEGHAAAGRSRQDENRTAETPPRRNETARHGAQAAWRESAPGTRPATRSPGATRTRMHTAAATRPVTPPGPAGSGILAPGRDSAPRHLRSTKNPPSLRPRQPALTHHTADREHRRKSHTRSRLKRPNLLIRRTPIPSRQDQSLAYRGSNRSGRIAMTRDQQSSRHICQSPDNRYPHGEGTPAARNLPQRRPDPTGAANRSGSATIRPAAVYAIYRGAQFVVGTFRSKRAAGCGLRAAGCGLRAAGCGLAIMPAGLHLADRAATRGMGICTRCRMVTHRYRPGRFLPGLPQAETQPSTAVDPVGALLGGWAFGQEVEDVGGGAGFGHAGEDAVDAVTVGDFATVAKRRLPQSSGGSRVRGRLGPFTRRRCWWRRR